MRLWSLHPKYLDTSGLNGLWKEACLAQSRLIAKGGGYYNHPELDRFKAHPRPLYAIGFYLYYVWLEAKERGFNYDYQKILYPNFGQLKTTPVSAARLHFERCHLLRKLISRNTITPDKHMYSVHPLFFEFEVY